MSQASEVDVLIVGAGPAGLMAATWMSRLGIKTRIVDKRGSKVFTGQADGFQARSLEILDSFGIGERVWSESNHMIEICLWNPDDAGQIHRSDRIPDSIVGLSRYTQVVLHQGRMERFFLDFIHEHSDIRVERGILPVKLEFDESKAEDEDAYPITLTLRHLSEEEATPAQNLSNLADGLFRSNLADDDTADLIHRSRTRGKLGDTEVVKAKYMIGCDGAHSWSRSQLGFSMEGEQTDFIWGVLDIIPITDFPDIRMRCAIHSANSGSLMVIPRENKLVRLYIQLNEVAKDGGRVDRSNISPEMILKAAQTIMSPYTLSYKYCDWWTAYQIGQRVGNGFSKNQRIFLAGDAVHTHSPKAGQGMNISMQDTYNLGWKIGLVVNNTMKRSILSTYDSERRQIAEELIEFDHNFSRLFSGRPAKDAADEAGISMEDFKKAFVKGHMFTSGIAVNYGPSPLVSKDNEAESSQIDGSSEMIASMTDSKSNQASQSSTSRQSGLSRVKSKQYLASNVRLGMRFPSHQVLNQADARPWPFQRILSSTGQFRIIVFAGNISTTIGLKRVNILGEQLSSSLLPLYTISSSTKAKTHPIEILTLHSAPRQIVELLDLHEVFHPFDDELGWDYDKVFVDGESYHEGHGEAYKGYGIGTDKGCVVIVRPDQYVGWIGDLEDVDEIKAWFAAILVAKT